MSNKAVLHATVRTELLHFAFAGSIHALGLTGGLALALLPTRTYRLLRMHARSWQTSAGARAAFLTVIVAAACAIALGLSCLARVFICLTEMRCVWSDG